MLLEAKISNPICIRLGKNTNLIMVDEKNNEVVPLKPGAMFSGEHYGFVLIVDYNGKQKEYVYPTQCRIDAVGIEGSRLKVFEEGKTLSWIFDSDGKLEYSAFDKFTDEFRSKFNVIVENYDMFMEEPTLKNPIRIMIALNPEESVILKDEYIQEEYPLNPGVMLGGEHYGFILIIHTPKGQKEITYPTQNRIEAIGMEGNFLGDIKVFEKGKYHPWLFSFDGQLKKESSYNPYSKNDEKFVEDCYELNSQEDDCFTLQKKNNKGVI